MSQVDERQTLEDFALKSMHLAKMTGVDLAVHAIKDGFLLMHTGVGCKYKTGVQIAQHDWVDHPNRREAWTQVGERHLIRGAGRRIGPYARSWQERRDAGFMVVVSAYFIELTGDDVVSFVEQTAETMTCPMAYVSTAGPNGGFYEGYSQVMLEAARALDWSGTPSAPGSAAIAGMMFHRYEADQQANVSAVRSLVKAAGLESGPMLFSGRPFAELAGAADCGVLILLPYARPHRAALKKLARGRRVVELDLPMGIAGTRRFATELAEARGGDPAPVGALIDRQADTLRPHLAHVRENLQGLSAAVFAEGPWAAGLVTVLHELGIRVRLVGLRESVLGGEEGFRTTVAKNGATLDPGIEIHVRPSLRLVRERMQELIRGGDVQLVLGSAIELSSLAHIADVRSASSRIALLETGFPSKDHHAALALPELGLQGTLVWAQRILDGLMSPRLGVRPLA